MRKQFLIAWPVIFILWMVGSYLIHGMFLKPEYDSVPNLFRTDAESMPYFPFMILAHVIMAAAFVLIYVRGSERKPWLSQGLRFGLLMSMMGVVPTYLIYFAIQPMPGAIVVKQILMDGLLVTLLGAAVAAIYRGHERA